MILANKGFIVSKRKLSLQGQQKPLCHEASLHKWYPKFDGFKNEINFSKCKC